MKYTDKHGEELVFTYRTMNGTTPNRETRRKHGIRRPLHLIKQHRDLLESLVEVADEGVEEIGAEPGVESV